ALLRLLHLYDHFGLVENFGGSVYYSGAGREIGLIRGIDPGAGAGFDAQLMPGGGEFPDRLRGQPDPIFLVLDFLRHADPHSPGSRSKAAHAQSSWMWYDSSWKTIRRWRAPRRGRAKTRGCTPVDSALHAVPLAHPNGGRSRWERDLVTLTSSGLGVKEGKL